MPADSSPRLFDRAAQRGAAAWLAVLMVLAGLTEGIGIVLLVPLLGALEHNRDNRLSAVLGTFGLPLRLDVLLAMFVAIVALRAIIVQARALAAMRLEYAVIDRLRQRAWQACQPGQPAPAGQPLPHGHKRGSTIQP